MSKTLYVNINNEQIQSNEELEVLNYDLDSDFFFYLGEKIAKGCKVENENALITDFNTQDAAEDYQQIITQWNEIKAILFGEDCDEDYEFKLPAGYIHWLKYHPQYVSVYDNNFSHGESGIIYIDLEELYEESVESMQRRILRKLQRDDLYRDIDEIVFNDDAVTRKSSIVCAIKEKYEGIGFKSYKKWLQDNDEKTHSTPQICEKCGKNPCECKKQNVLFPIEGVILNQTPFNNVQQDFLEEDDEFHYISYKPRPGILFIQESTDKFFSSVTIYEEQAYPKTWENMLGLKWGTIYDNCKNTLEKNCNKILWDKENTVFSAAAWTNQIVFIPVNNDYVIDVGFMHRKLAHITVYSNICPFCHSNNLNIFNNYDFNVNIKCNNCKRLLINGLECPECGSLDIEDNGTETFRCNKCGNYFG